MLKAHEGQARHGWLRYTCEGLVAMSAMSLAYIALLRDFHVEVENDYLPLGYLYYLLTISADRS